MTGFTMMLSVPCWHQHTTRGHVTECVIIINFNLNSSTSNLINSINLTVIHPTTVNHIAGFSFHKIKKMHATVFSFIPPPSTGPFLPNMTQDSIIYLRNVGLVHSWTDVWAHTRGNIPDYKWKVQSGYSLKVNKSQNEGTAKAEESSRLQCLWGLFLECITGTILVDGKTDIINIVQNNIYCCWKLLSAMLFFHKLWISTIILLSTLIHC